MENLNFTLPKHVLSTLVMAAILFFGTSYYSYAQDEDPIYTTVSFMKVKQGNTDDYLQVERELWKPLHQELVNRCQILGWYLYRIQYTGTGDDYNFATVMHYQGSKNLDAGYPDDLFVKVHPNMPDGYMSEKTEESRDLVTSQLLEWRLQSFPEGQREPSRYAVVNYMKTVPGTSGFFALRRDYIKPAFDQAVKDGKVEGWGLWSTMFPSGADMSYNFVTGNFHNEFSQIGNVNLGEYMEKANPGKNMDEIWQKLGETRRFAKRELWELIDYVR